jgi:septal ring factor EnvC (AmiA/AmiB activator)
LGDLEETVDARLHETQPIWESVLMRLDSMDERFNSIEEKMDTFHRYLREFHKDTVDMRSRINKLEDIVLPPLS